MPGSPTATAALALSALLATAGAGDATAATEVNLLTWCDHTDEKLLEPFEQAHDAKVNVKVYELTGAAVSLLEQSRPGDWDVFMLDSADVVRMGKAGWLEPLRREDFPFDDMFAGAAAPELHESDGQLWAVPEKFGYNTFAYDKTKLGPNEELSLKILWDPRFDGRIAVYDYYTPIIMTVGLAMGITPDRIDAAALDAIRPKLMALKDQSKMVGDTVSTQIALASGEVDFLLGSAESGVANLMREKPNLDWGMPVEGGFRWSQSVGVFKQSTRKEMATRFVQYLVGPEGQAALATASCYWGMPMNRKAALAPEERAALHFERLESELARSIGYATLPGEIDEKMNELWAEFLQR